MQASVQLLDQRCARWKPGEIGDQCKFYNFFPVRLCMHKNRQKCQPFMGDAVKPCVEVIFYMRNVIIGALQQGQHGGGRPVALGSATKKGYCHGLVAPNRYNELVLLG